MAEAKFQSQRACYVPLIERQDAEGIMDALTDRAVELKVLALKALALITVKGN